MSEPTLIAAAPIRVADIIGFYASEPYRVRPWAGPRSGMIVVGHAANAAAVGEVVAAHRGEVRWKKPA